MDNLQRLAAETALRKMADNGWLDICVIDKILKLAGAIPDKRAYGILSLLHCVNFRDMPAEVREQLPALLGDVLGGDPIDLVGALSPKHPPGSVVVLDAAPAKSWLRRLTGGG